MISFSVTSFKKVISEFLEDSVQIPTQQKLDHLILFRRPNKASGRSAVSNICPNDVALPSRRTLVSRSFEQFKVTSVRTSWQHV